MIGEKPEIPYRMCFTGAAIITGKPLARIIVYNRVFLEKCSIISSYQSFGMVRQWWSPFYIVTAWSPKWSIQASSFGYREKLFPALESWELRHSLGVMPWFRVQPTASAKSAACGATEILVSLLEFGYKAAFRLIMVTSPRICSWSSGSLDRLETVEQRQVKVY